jgi:two-component system cell cycle sensor histidine kinase/response regulator CckA
MCAAPPSDFDAARQIEHLQGEVRRLQEALAESERAAEALRVRTAEVDLYFTNALDLLSIADTEGHFRRLNPAWETVLGYPLEELEGRQFLDFVHPDDLEATRRAIGQLLEQRHVLGFANRFRARDGSFRWLEWRTFPSGRTLYAVARDVTEQRRAKAALEESRRMLRLILDTIPVRVFWKDDAGRYMGCNQSFARDAGFSSPEELVGRDDYEMGWKEQAELYRADDVRVMTSGVARLQYEEPQTTPTGSQRWLRTSKVPLQDAEGRTIGMLGTYEDITERVLEQRRAEDQRAKLEAQLQHSQKMESVGRLAGGVAHDFNNMLLVILGSSELIKHRWAGDAALRAEMEEIDRAATRARDLTRQLLAFSRRQVIAPRSLDLSEFVVEMGRTLGRLIGEDVDLRIHAGEGLWPVRIDHSQVDQVLMNLCVNARDAMPNGGKLTIETANVRLDEDYCRQHVGFEVGEYVLLAVSDNGVGIDRDTLPHVFEPFFTTKATGRGTGLGLATVYGIVTQNGGVLNAYSEPGHGTTFKVYLPRLRDASALPVASDEKLPPLGGGTVLLVEDDEAVRRITAAMLDALGFVVLVADGWRAALALAQKDDCRIDLLLTDVVMPEVSGRELADRLRAVCPKVRVLYASGYTANVIAHHGILDEDVHFIQKPFSMDELARGIRKALRPD